MGEKIILFLEMVEIVVFIKKLLHLPVLQIKIQNVIYSLSLCFLAAGVIVSRPGVEPRPMAVKVPSPNYGPTEIPQFRVFILVKIFFHYRILKHLTVHDNLVAYFVLQICPCFSVVFLMCFMMINQGFFHHPQKLLVNLLLCFKQYINFNFKKKIFKPRAFCCCC